MRRGPEIKEATTESDPRFMYYGPEVPEHVIQKIYDFCPEKFQWILRSMRWSDLMGCWMVTVFGMEVGIEIDGYIHS